MREPGTKSRAGPNGAGLTMECQNYYAAFELRLPLASHGGHGLGRPPRSIRLRPAFTFTFLMGFHQTPGSKGIAAGRKDFVTTGDVVRRSRWLSSGPLLPAGRRRRAAISGAGQRHQRAAAGADRDRGQR